VKKLESLGLSVTTSVRDGAHAKSVDFGSEAIEIFSENEKLNTLDHVDDLATFLKEGEGIYGVALESDHIAQDYKRLTESKVPLQKPRVAKDQNQDIPLWTGFTLPVSTTPLTHGWVVMNSPGVLNAQAKQILPLAHPNTCFGIEAIHLISPDPQVVATQWGALVEKPVSGVQWNDIDVTSGKRIQIGDRFLDCLKETQGLLKISHGRRGPFMLTLKVVDLELARGLAQKAGANPKPCTSRDGFYIDSSFTGGCALRFVRTFWKRYLPMVSSNYPLGRRVDKFRPLGGANTSTLTDGFEDNWKY